MTEKANPSINRPAEAYKTAGAIAYGGHGEGGFVVPAASPTDISVQDAGIDHTVLNAFDATLDAANDTATIDPGEAFVFGTWLATDETYTVSLAADTTGQTVYVGWNKSGPDDVIVGLESAFSESVGDTDERIPLWDFDTSQDFANDVRTLGYTEYIEGKSFYGDEDFSLSYNASTDELEIVDEVNGIIKASFDKNGDVHIKNGDLDLRADLRDDTTTVYNSAGGYLEQAALENDSITLNDGDGITAPVGSVSLGGSTNVDVNVDDLVGPFISNDGTNAFQVNLGATLQDDGSGNIIVDGSSDIGFSSTQTFTGNIDLASSGRIKNSPSPADPDDLAPKAYVDAIGQGLDIKDSVRVATDGVNIDLTSATDPNPVDGVTLADGDRVLLKDQTDATENGIYDAVTATDPTTWVRSDDADKDVEVTAGMFMFVEEGTNLSGNSYVLTTNDPITLGTTSLTFTVFAKVGEITAGDGLSKTGDTLNTVIADLVGTGLEDDGSNNARIASAVAGTGLTGGSGSPLSIDEPQRLVERPTRPPLAVLEDTESVEIPVRVPNGSTLEVYRWGAYDASSGSAVTGLDVELLDDGDVVQASANTANSEDTTNPVTTHTNSSGTVSVFKLRAYNGTGGVLETPGVGAHFGFRVV